MQILIEKISSGVWEDALLASSQLMPNSFVEHTLSNKLPKKKSVLYNTKIAMVCKALLLMLPIQFPIEQPSISPIFIWLDPSYGYDT